MHVFIGDADLGCQGSLLNFSVCLSSGEHFNSYVHSIDTSCSAFVLKNVKFMCKER